MFLYKKIRNILIFILAIGYIVFEEIFWIRIAKPIYQYIEKFHLYEKFLNYVQFKMNKYLLLSIFLILFVVSELMGPLALKYLFGGEILLGIILYILKMFPLIIAFAIFERGKEKLFSFNWFKISYDFIIFWIDKLKNSKVFLSIKENIYKIKEIIKRKIKTQKKNLHKELFNEAKDSIKKKIKN